MRMILFGILSCAVIVQTPPKDPVPPNTIRIDGREQPERIPDHWVWRAAFLRLNETKRTKGEEAMSYDLPLDSLDAAVLYGEAVKQPQRDSECIARLRDREEALRRESAPPKVAVAARDEITIQCRTRDLDAADRVLDAISDGGRRILTDWIEKRRRTIVAFVPEQEIETFRLPR